MKTILAVSALLAGSFFWQDRPIEERVLQAEKRIEQLERRLDALDMPTASRGWRLDEVQGLTKALTELRDLALPATGAGEYAFDTINRVHDAISMAQRAEAAFSPLTRPQYGSDLAEAAVRLHNKVAKAVGKPERTSRDFVIPLRLR